MLTGVWVDWSSNTEDKNLLGEWHRFVGGHVWAGPRRVCLADYQQPEGRWSDEQVGCQGYHERYVHLSQKGIVSQFKHEIPLSVCTTMFTFDYERWNKILDQTGDWHSMERMGSTQRPGKGCWYRNNGLCSAQSGSSEGSGRRPPCSKVGDLPAESRRRILLNTGIWSVVTGH